MALTTAASGQPPEPLRAEATALAAASGRRSGESDWWSAERTFVAGDEAGAAVSAPSLPPP